MSQIGAFLFIICVAGSMLCIGMLAVIASETNFGASVAFLFGALSGFIGVLMNVKTFEE